MNEIYDREEAELEASRAPLLEHLTELRGRLFWCVGAFFVAFLVCFFYSSQIYRFLLHPFEVAGQLLDSQKASGGHHGPFDLLLALVNLKHVPLGARNTLELVYTSPLEFFFTKLKLAGLGAVILAFPVIAMQLYRFVAPGLYRRERKAFLPFLIASPILFLMGAALVYYVMLPFVLWFSLSQQITGGGVNVHLLPKVSDYFNLVTALLLSFGLCFQLPVVLTLLGLSGMVSSRMLSSVRRFAILGVVVVAAVITPPDPISQIMLALPIILLYEISIWCVRLIEIRRKREDGEAEA